MPMVVTDDANTTDANTVPKRSFIKERHLLRQQVLLNQDFIKIDTPARMRNIKLYDHQRTIVRAMVDLENKRILAVETDDMPPTKQTAIIESSAMVLSEKFGTGKTIIMLAFIAEQPIPKAFPVHMNTMAVDTKALDRYTYYIGFKHEIVRTYTGQNALIRTNLIVAGSSVLIQWRQAIENFTDFKVLTVSDHHSLKKFIEYHAKGQLHAFDIILLKNGTVTGNLSIPGDDKAKNLRSLITTIGQITSQQCWARVIYDDFDTISIPAGSYAINALMTIYVSATTKYGNGGARRENFKTLDDYMTNALVPLNIVSRDTVLFSNFNIRNTEEFTELSTNITKIQGYKYVYANPDDNFIRLIGVIGDEAKEIMEMLNGDAAATAAEALGIKTKSAADIFQRVLENKYDKFKLDQKVLAAIDQFKVMLDEFEEKYIKPEDITAAKNALEKGNIPKIRYYSQQLAEMIDIIEAEWLAEKERDGIAIERVLDNIREGSCQICYLPLGESDTFILRCCGIILCSTCGVKGNNLQRRFNHKEKNYALVGKCANCRSDINPRRDLIYVDKNFDIESMLNSDGIEEEPVIGEVPVVVDVAGDCNDHTTAAGPSADSVSAGATPVVAPKVRNPKIQALLDLCAAKTPESQEEITIEVAQLLKGKVDIPANLANPRKVLVFANYNETLDNIREALVENNIPFLQLGGTYLEKAATVKRFREYGTVLMINSQSSCAGLDIQFATDIVVTHRLNDNNIQGQILGRGQRLGRTENLRIHYLLYNNERAVF